MLDILRILDRRRVTVLAADSARRRPRNDCFARGGVAAGTEDDEDIAETTAQFHI